MTKKRDQPAQRRSAHFTDQHGRKWAATIEVDSMCPVGALSAIGFRPPVLPNGRPLQPPHNCFLFNPIDMSALKLDYETWIAELEQAQAEWDDNFARYAQGIGGEQVAQLEAHPTPTLLRMVGPKPMPIELVEACRDGDAWALGLPLKPGVKRLQYPEAPPAHLQPFVDMLAPLRRRAAELTT